MKWARNLFIVLAWIFLAFILLQVFLAGLGLFVGGEHWEWHKKIAGYFALVPVGMLVLSFFGKLPVRLRWLCLGLYLMVIGQFLTALYSSAIGALSALHPIIALLLFWGSITTVKRGWFKC